MIRTLEIGLKHIIVRSFAAALASAVGACSSAPLTNTGHLSSYENLRRSHGLQTRSQHTIDSKAARAAKTVRIIPTIVAGQAQQSGLSNGQLRLVSNAIDRALCSKLGERFAIKEQSADLTVHAVVTYVKKTEVAAAALSKVVGIGGSIAGAATGTPIPTPRLPIGMGSLSMEAFARDHTHRQIAAIVWARDADMITTSARVAEESDAYALATEFSADFSKLLIDGVDPTKLTAPQLPTHDGVREFFRISTKPGCERFGKNPGLVGSIGSMLGTPPSWDHSGAN